MCVSLTRALLSKNQSAVNVCKRNREEYCDYKPYPFSGARAYYRYEALHLQVQMSFLFTYSAPFNLFYYKFYN